MNIMYVGRTDFKPMGTIKNWCLVIGRCTNQFGDLSQSHASLPDPFHSQSPASLPSQIPDGILSGRFDPGILPGMRSSAHPLYSERVPSHPESTLAFFGNGLLPASAWPCKCDCISMYGSAIAFASCILNTRVTISHSSVYYIRPDSHHTCLYKLISNAVETHQF